MTTKRIPARPAWLGLILFLVPWTLFAATNELKTALSKALFEEEANHNLGAAIRYYQSAIEHFDMDRELAATAVFRLGECYRKQNNTNDAKAQYHRILQDFADQNQFATLSRQYLVALGSPPSDQERTAKPAETVGKMTDLGEISRVRSIIDNSPDLINAPDQSGRTLLQTYSGKGDVEVIDLLLTRGAAANGIKQPDLTPLHFAAGNGHKAAVELLLGKGAKVDPLTASGVTPLHLAVLKGYGLVAKVLLDSGANANAAVTRDASSSGDLSYSVTAYQTPLHLACAAGYAGLVDLLVSKGADVNAQDGSGRTPLTVAIDANSEGMVKALLAAHADPNAGRSSALNLAASKGNVGLLDLLVAHGAKLDLADALREAVTKNHPAAVSKLIQFKADPNVKFATGEPLALWALNSPDLLRALLEGGADPNQRSSQGNSLLERATDGEAASVQMLLEHGANPNATNSQGWTALHRAAANSKLGPAEVLLKNGANVNALSLQGETPLHLSVRTSNPEMTALLLEHGANPNLQNHNGETPLDYVKVYQGNQPPGLMLPGSPGRSTDADKNLINELLLRHGALTDLPRMDRIEVRRFPSYAATVFSRSSGDVNRFSLLELLAAHYGFISDSPWQNPVSVNTRRHTPDAALQFPNLNQIEIRHPRPGGTNWTTIALSAEAVLDSGDCAGDVWLNWGDQVDIAEADHPVSSPWPGFSSSILTNLLNCVKRTVYVTVKGQTTSLRLEGTLPSINLSYQSNPIFTSQPPQFFLLPALQNSKLLRISSDLSRVKVTRHNTATREDWEKTFDCSGTPPEPVLWLRDGDRIDVPDKP